MTGWKTHLLNVLQLAATVAAWPELTAYLTPQQLVWVSLGVNTAMRLITTGPDGIRTLLGKILTTGGSNG